MIQWNNIPIYRQIPTLFTMPIMPYASHPSIFSYNPFTNIAPINYNFPVIAPTPQGISSFSNPFGGLYNFTMPSFNYTNILNNVKTTTSNLYNRTKQTAKNVATTVGHFASRILNNAKKYLGYNEKDGSYKKFTNGRNEAWCADFATYVARESGANIPHFSSVSQILNWGNKNNRFSKTPKAGDIIIFKGVDKNGKRVSHTGIVKEVKNGIVYTIEGNTKNKVNDCEYGLNDSRITGYVSVA